MWLFIYEALKTAGALVLVAFLLVAYALLSGCVSIEGSGFSNSGAYQRPACVQKDSRGNERWYSC